VTAAAARSVTIDAVIRDGAIRTLFQPIVHLQSQEVVGFEALSRGPADTPMESPAVLIEAARVAGRLGELDWLCRAHAMEAVAASGLHLSLSWFINVEPAGLEIACPAYLVSSLAQARTDLRVVLARRRIALRDPQRRPEAGTGRQAGRAPRPTWKITLSTRTRRGWCWRLCSTPGSSAPRSRSAIAG